MRLPALAPLLSLIALIAASQSVNAQAPTKPRLAIQDISATPAVMQQAAAAAGEEQLNVLQQILQGADSQLMDTINKTKRFDIVARSKWKSIIREQEIATSGDVNPADPQTARAFMMAGAKYVATITVDNYQDITARMQFEGGFGQGAGERREIQLQATLQIFDTTTAVMLESGSITLSEADINEVLPGARETGRATNALIGKVTKLFATQSANLIMNRLAPAKVLAYTMGNITFNRGEGTGIEIGQYWEVFHPGEEMIDPDTGESLGAEEIPLGWAQVTQVTPKFSKARCLEDYGIDRGNIMRLSAEGLPGTIDPNSRCSGSASPRASAPPAASPPPIQNVPAAPSPHSTTRCPECGQPILAASPPPSAIPSPVQNTPVQTPPAPSSTAAEPVTLALFIRDVSPEVPDQKVMVLENYLNSCLTDRKIAIINRADVLNAVSGLANDGPNVGTGNPINTETERLLSDQTSAVALARNLGADGLVMATITSLQEDRREIRDPQRGNYDNIFYTLDVAWTVVDGGTGSTIASNIAQARQGIRQTSTQRMTFNIDTLLRDAATQACQGIQLAMARPDTRRPVAAANEVPVQIRVTLADLSVPEIRQQDDGSYIIGANRYQLEPMACNVMVDGVMAGSAPGVIYMTPGMRRIRIERPMVQPYEKYLNAKAGLMINVPLALSAEGRRQWQEQTRFFEELKNGAVLRDTQLKEAEAMAEFMRNSSMNIDTSGLQKLQVDGVPSLWMDLMDMVNNQ